MDCRNVNFKEKRQHPRASIDVKVNYANKAIAYTKNISEGGICIITEKPLEPTEIVNLVFTLPNGDQIKTYGKTIWRKKSTEHLYENGLEFWELNDINKNRILAYLDSTVE